MITNHSRVDLELRLKNAEEENELLLLQLHQLQEELEQHYLRDMGIRAAQPGVSKTISHAENSAHDALLEVLAENQRLRVLVSVQRKLYQIEARNALNARLGDILIDAADAGSAAALLRVPFKFAKIWREAKRRTPPQELGGTSFARVISAYSEGGFDAVEKLLAQASSWPVVQANAYTALARHLMKTQRATAAEAARRAHTLDPKPYRLKWLAFRLHDAGDLSEAEAILDLLPSDTPLSDSEIRQAGQLRYEAKYQRFRNARRSLFAGAPETESLQTTDVRPSLTSCR